MIMQHIRVVNGRRAVPLALDVCRQNSVEAAFRDAAAALGALDLLVNNAGVPSLAKPVTAISRSFWMDGETLRYELKMGLEGAAAIRHLTGSFRRSG